MYSLIFLRSPKNVANFAINLSGSQKVDYLNVDKEFLLCCYYLNLQKDSPIFEQISITTTTDIGTFSIKKTSLSHRPVGEQNNLGDAI